MAANDPLNGEKDVWRGDDINVDPKVPTLYHCDASYYSQIARLALVEKHVNDWKSRHITLVDKKENLDSWYLQLNPKGQVPVLVHGDKTTTGAVTIAKYVNDRFEGPNLVPSDARARVEKLIVLHEAIDVNKLISGFYVKHNAVGKVVVPKDIEHGIRKLQKLTEEEKDGSIKRAAEDKKKELEELKKKFEEDPDHVFDEEKPKLIAALDALETELSGENREGKFLAGTDYTLADVIYTVLLARIHFTSELAQEVKNRPKVAEYWELVRERPSFKQADIWDHLRTGLVAHLLSETLRDGVIDGFVLTGAFFNEHVTVPVVKAGQATGEFIHEKVVVPIVESPTYKVMSLAASHAAHQTQEFFNDKIVHPVTESEAFKDIKEKTESGSHSFFESIKSASSYVVEKSTEAATYTMDAAHKATEYVVKATHSNGEENGHEETKEEGKEDSKKEEEKKEDEKKKEEEEKK